MSVREMNKVDLTKRVDPKTYLANLEDGVTWPDLDAFARWYISKRMPMAPPHNARVFITDNATSICLFKRGRFQVEQYLVHPSLGVGVHSHPGVETILMPLGDGSPNGVAQAAGVSSAWGIVLEKVKDLEEHGNDSPPEVFVNLQGNILLAFERWDEDIEMTSDAVRWKGKTAGPMQEALIREFYPDAYVVDGYADVTRKKDDKNA